jgi:hypothetical protein
MKRFVRSVSYIPVYLKSGVNEIRAPHPAQKLKGQSFEMSIRSRRPGPRPSIGFELRGNTDREGVELRRLLRLEVHFAPIAWLFGVGLTGFGVDGFCGAGVALMAPATLVFVVALLDQPAGYGSRRPRRKRTLRHRYLLWSDQLGWKRDRRKQLRRERKEAERDFLERRKRRGR